MKRNFTILLSLGTIAVMALSASMASANHSSDDPADHVRHRNGIVDPAARNGGNDGVRRSGSCSGRSSWKLKAKHRDGRIETEFEVDQNRSGVQWNFRILRNGTMVAQGTRVTRSPSGSFSVERRIADPAGEDRIRAVATRNGETCRGSLTV